MITFVAVFKPNQAGLLRQYWYDSNNPQQADTFRVQHAAAMAAGQAVITVPVDEVGINPLEDILP